MTQIAAVQYPKWVKKVHFRKSFSSEVGKIDHRHI